MDTVPAALLRTADALLPGAAWERARLGRGGSHDVVLLPGVAAVRVATHPTAAAELPRRSALLYRLGKAGLPFAVPEPLGEVVTVDGRTAVALSWVDGAPTPRGQGDPAGIRALLAALAAVNLSDLDDLLGPAHAYAGGSRWPEVMAEVVALLPAECRDEARARLDAAWALPPVPPQLVHGDLAGENVHWDAAGTSCVGVLDWDYAQAFDPAVDAGCLSWHGWHALRAAVDPETFRRARTWYLTFGLEQVAVALLRGDPARVLAEKVAQAVAWLDRTTRRPPPL
ncbi:MAG TPA: phosphotransferase [Rugosimonospora sp.]|nr:phosphotransferase [Rugosimonospora sp.]